MENFELKNDVDLESIHRFIAKNVPAVTKKYRLSTFLGRGHSSKVVKGIAITKDDDEYAIKLLGLIGDAIAIKREIEVLKKMRGAKNVVQYVEHFKNGQYTALVTNFLDGVQLRKVYTHFTPSDVRSYMQNLLACLAEVHLRGFFHGDVKPANFLFTEDLKSFLLIDFGMSQEFKTQLRNRGTRGFKPLEIILTYHTSTSVVDIWSAGVIFASLLSGVYPFFEGKGKNALKEFCIIFGAEAVLINSAKLGKLDYVESSIMNLKNQKALDLQKLCFFFRNYDKLILDDDAGEKCSNCRQFIIFCLCLRPLINPLDENIAQTIDQFPPSAYNLLKQMLALDPEKRITADEALNHSFFKEKMGSSHYCELSGRKFRGIVSALFEENSFCSSDEDCKQNFKSFSK